MKYERLYNFISIKTGKIVLEKGYMLTGDNDGFSYSSPILYDLKQDIIDIRRKVGAFTALKSLDYNRIWIGDLDNEAVPRINIGVINLPLLEEAKFPNPLNSITGDVRIPNPTFDYVSPFDWVMSGPFLPQIFATKYDSLGNPVGTEISSSLAMTQVRTAQIMKRFDNANFIVGSSTVTFGWENPKMLLIPEQLKQLYGLGTTYSFTKAQSLGALETGLLKNTVNNSIGTLSKAISGEDYVNTANITAGKLVIIDPLYPLAGHKLIAPSNYTPNDIDSVFTKLNAVINIVKNIIGVKDAIDIVNVTENQAKAVTNAIKNMLGSKITDEIVDVTTKATSLASNAASLIEIEAQIAALAGVQTITTLGTILGFLGVTIGGKAYGDYIRGQSLNIKNTYKSADLNDEGHNAVGDFEFRYPSGYSSDDRGYSTLWFDSNGRNSSHRSSAGLRLFSWDSGGDHLGYDAPLAPLHIGIFGYQNKYHVAPIPNPTPVYKGFIFECDFHNEYSGDEYYRFPKKFGLYDVKRTISTFFTQKWGWDYKNPIFEYDYSNFTFNKPVVLKEYTNFEKEVDFHKNVKFLGTGAIKIPVGNTSERPTIAELGMIRYNIET